MRSEQATRRLALDVALVVAARALATFAVLATGFLALSDDDYARVVIAQRWAAAPKLDPTGTSWLPVPFWVTGTAMMAFGRSLEVARAVAVALGVCSALVGYVAARWLLGPSRGAAAAAGLAMLLPGAAVLGVATVPELPSAALSLLAMAALASGAQTTVVTADAGADLSRRRVLGACALVVATLSRYEPWAIAAGFVALSLRDALRARREGRGATARWFARAAAIAAAGPLLWLAWNRLAHGDALAFAKRVADYRRALGSGGEGALTALASYLRAALKAEAALVALVATALILAAFKALRPPELREHLARHARPALLCAALVVGLSFAAALDGAPTHHPERALLVVVCWGALLAVHVHLAIARHARGRARVAHLLVTGTALGLAAFFVRPAGEDTRRRADHEAIGRAARAVVAPGEKVLVEVEDYGHLAVTAAFGRPEDVIADRDIDPRASPRQDSFSDVDLLVARLEETKATHAIARMANAAMQTVAARPAITCGSWGAWPADDIRSPLGTTQ